MIFSILIASLNFREQMLKELEDELWRQIDLLNARDKVEILVGVDRGEATTGYKRNMLLHRASGQYVAFIDDDDMVYEWYIEEILKAAETNADCFSITGIMTTDGKREIPWVLGKDLPNITVADGNGGIKYHRTTNHLSPVKREIALRGMFPDISCGEDKTYSERINPFLKTEFAITKPMYHYKYISTNKTYNHVQPKR